MKINKAEKFLDCIKSKNTNSGTVVFNKKLKRHYYRNKKWTQIDIYIITNISLGRESKKGGNNITI